MLQLRDETLTREEPISGSTTTTASSSSLSGSSSVTWFYLSFEFLVGLAVSGFIVFLTFIKSLLPKPPRDLSGDVVLVTGATSNLGSSLAEEFARGGCSVICVDSAGSDVEETASRLRSLYKSSRENNGIVEEIGSTRRFASNDSSIIKNEEDEGRNGLTIRSYAYRCNVWDRDEIRELAIRVQEEIGKIDVLVTCAGGAEQDVFDTVSRTLMSHYWTVLAFLPSMLLQRGRAHVIGITPSVSTEDAYMGSKAAVAGLMDSLGRQFRECNGRLTFMTVAPKAEPRLIEQNEREIAKEVVQAVRRDMCCIGTGWGSKLFYYCSCKLYNGISTITAWLDT